MNNYMKLFVRKVGKYKPFMILPDKINVVNAEHWVSCQQRCCVPSTSVSVWCLATVPSRWPKNV